MIVTVTVNKNNNNDRIGSTENPGKKEGRKEGEMGGRDVCLGPGTEEMVEIVEGTRTIKEK